MQLPSAQVVSSIQLSASAISLVFGLVLLVLYTLLSSKIPQAFAPGPILLNITSINILISLKYVILGAATLIHGEQARSHSFGINTYNCDFEGFTTLTLMIFLTGWTLIWIFDLWVSLNRRYSLQEDRSTYYMILIYFLGSIISLIFYFSSPVSPFSLNQWNKTCSVKEGAYYYFSIDLLLALYSCVSSAFLFKLCYLKYFLPAALTSNITFKKIFILLFYATNIWGVLYQIYNHQLLQLVFIVTSAIQPGIFALPWIIQAFRALRTYNSHLKQPEYFPTQRSFFDYAQQKLLDRQSVEMTNSEHFNSESDSPSIRRGREPLVKQIIELLIQGMEESFDQRKRKLSATGLNTHRKIFEQLSIKTPTQRSKCLQILCCCCFKIMFARDNALTQEEVDNERGELVFGHTAVLNKVDLILKEVIISESKVIRSYDVPINMVQAKKLRKVYNRPVGAFFKVTAPRVFRNLRRMHDIQEEVVSSAFSEIALKNKMLKRDHNNKDGKIIIRAIDSDLKLVSITNQEYRTLKAILPNFYTYFYMNPKSYLLPIYGCFTLQIGDQNIFQPQHFILQPETIYSPFTHLHQGNILTFEFKGVEDYEQVLADPRYLREPLELDAERIASMLGQDHVYYASPHKFLSTKILRENDFFMSLIKLDVSNEQAHTILSQFKQDLEFLVAHNFSRYFTRLKIIYKPFKKISLVHNLLSPQNSERGEEGDLMIADDHEHSIILREEGVSYKFFHICEKSSLQLIREIEDEREGKMQPFGSMPDLTQSQPIPQTKKFSDGHQGRLVKSQSFSHIHAPQHIINFELKGHQHLPLASQSSCYVPPSLDESVDLNHQLQKCRLCHQQFPRNHIIEVTHAPKTSTFGPSSDIVERDAIEQIIVDPTHGLIKREIHFCIQGYLDSGHGQSGFSQYFMHQEVKASEVENYAQALYHCMESVFE